MSALIFIETVMILLSCAYISRGRLIPSLTNLFMSCMSIANFLYDRVTNVD